MGFVRNVARILPPRLRRACRDLTLKACHVGPPTPLLKSPQAELSVTLDMVLSHYRQTHAHVCYLQVGAFDGVSGDPIYPLIEKYSLKGFLLEPQRDAFEKLKVNYSRFADSFVFVNAAIAARDGSLPLYTIQPDAEGPDWMRQIASFDKATLMKHASNIPDLAAKINVENVRCVTFTTLFKEIGTDNIDLLQIDAEGYDAEILRLYDVPSRKPAIIRFEHKHISQQVYERSLTSLIAEGYKIAQGENDTLGYLHP